MGKKKAEQKHKQALEKEENSDGKDDILKASSSKRGRAGDLPEGKDYMNDTVEIAEMKDAKKKKGNPDAFGWDVFNQDSLLRAHEKRLKNVEFDEKAYTQQKQQLENEVTPALFDGFGFKDTD